MTFRLASLYCGIVSAAAVAVLLFSPFSRALLNGWEVGVALWLLLSAFVVGAFLKPKDEFQRGFDFWIAPRGTPVWAWLILFVLVLENAVLPHGMNVGLAVATAFCAALHVSGARVWGARRICQHYHDAGYQARYCPICGARTQDRFLPEALIQRAHRQAALQKMLHPRVEN